MKSNQAPYRPHCLIFDTANRSKATFVTAAFNMLPIVEGTKGP
jgi:hypothetical protein